MENKECICIVTGASDNHFYTSLNFVKSLSNSDMNYKCYYFDLGLNDQYINILKTQYPFLIYKKFNYKCYPSYFNININAGEYAWKPAIIYDVAQIEKDVILWCDAGNLLKGSMRKLYDMIKKNNIFSPTSSGNIQLWTHEKVLQYFDITDINFTKYENRNGAILGFNLNNSNVMDFISEFYKYAQIKEAIAPEGSNRSNHRQDQALFTILYYKNLNKCQIIQVNDYVSLSIHNDI